MFRFCGSEDGGWRLEVTASPLHRFTSDGIFDRVHGSEFRVQRFSGSIFNIQCSGYLNSNTNMLNIDTIETFINYLKSQKGYSDHTIRNYRIDLKQFLDFLIEKRRSAEKEETSAGLESIDFLTIRGYLGNLYGRYKRTNISRKHRKSKLLNTSHTA